MTVGSSVSTLGIKRQGSFGCANQGHSLQVEPATLPARGEEAEEETVRIWLIGADRAGMVALRQLQKNADIDVVVSASTDRPRAVTEGLIAKVDHVEYVTPLNVNKLAKRINPDLILLDYGAEERSFGRVAGGTAFSEALNFEIASASEYPCLVL